MGSVVSFVRGRRVTGRATAVVGAVLLAASLTACQPGSTWGVAGNGSSGASGDTGPATGASLMAPGPLVAIPGGGFYVGDTADCVIRKVDTHGVITTVAGISGKCGSTGDGGPATQAEISGHAFGLALDAAGALYIAYCAPEAPLVRVIDPNGIIRSLPGTTDPMLGFVVKADGTVVELRDYSQMELLTVAPNGQITTTPVSAVGDDTLVGLADLHDGGYAAKSLYHSGIYRIDGNSGSVTQISPAGGNGYWSLVSAADDTLYVVDDSNHVVRIGNDPGHTVTVIAGNGTADPANAVQSGLGTSLSLSPAGLAVTPNNGLLISSGHVVYRLDNPATAG